MSEKLIRAKRWDQLWFLNINARRFDIISVIAWAIPDSGPAIPITAFGRFDVANPYVVGDGVGFIAFPEGRVLHDSNDVQLYLRERNAPYAA
jgi:hypothetical protein